jgi:hypothetical protein
MPFGYLQTQDLRSGEKPMLLTECPGCCSRMVNGKCSLCGFVDSSYVAQAAVDAKIISDIGSDLMQNVPSLPEGEAASAIRVEKKHAVETTPPSELIDCPSCSHRVSELSTNCPKCGLSFTAVVLEVQRKKRADAERPVNWNEAIGVVVALIVFGIVWLGMSSEKPFLFFVVAGLPMAGLICFIGMIVKLSPEEHERVATQAEVKRHLDSKIVCPQCQERGFVATEKVTEKAGIHGGKATAAILTGGISLLATGLSNELGKTQAACSNCGSVWRF